MGYMFRGTYAFNQDISGWDVSRVTDMTQMFQGSTTFNQDISSWDISKVSHMVGMFRWAYEFNQDLCAWKEIFPYNDCGEGSDGIFYKAGCSDQNIPLETEQGPFCAASICPTVSTSPSTFTLEGGSIDAKQQFYIGNGGRLHSLLCPGLVVSNSGIGEQLTLETARDESSEWTVASDGLIESVQYPDAAIGIDGSSIVLASKEAFDTVAVSC